MHKKQCSELWKKLKWGESQNPSILYIIDERIQFRVESDEFLAQIHDEKCIFMVESLIKQIIMIRSNVWHITRMVVSSISLCEYVFYLFCTAYFAFARYCKALLSIIHIWMNSPKHTFTTTKIDCTKIAPAIPCILNSH